MILMVFVALSSAKSNKDFPYYKVLRPDPVLGYRYNPNVDVMSLVNGEEIPFHFNEQGFRDSDFKLKNGKIKILAIGASYTYGVGIRAEERWSNLLEARLCDTSVYNVSVGGYLFDQVFLLLDRELKQRSYDLIIFQVPQVTGNHLHMSPNTWTPGSRKPYFQLNRGGLKIISSSHDIPLYIDQIPTNQILKKIAIGYNHIMREYVLFPYTKEDSENLSKEIFQYYINELNRKKIPIVFISHDNFVMEILKKLKGEFSYIDALKYSRGNTYEVSSEIGHVNAEGNTLLAKDIYEHLRSNGLIPGAQCK